MLHAWSYVRRNAVAFLALFVALGGTATATHLAVDGSDVVDESLTGADIEGSAATDVDGTIRGEDVKDGSLNTRELAVGAVNSLRIADSTITGEDVQGGSLSQAHLNEFTKSDYFVRSLQFDSVFVDQASGTTALGDTDGIAVLDRTTASGVSRHGAVRVGCTDSGFRVGYENWESSGHQRVWTDNGSSVRYRTLAADSSLTALSSSAAVPDAAHVTLAVRSINLPLYASFDVLVARTPQGRGNPCLWHVTTVSENG